MTIGETLRAIRKKKKMTVPWLAYYAQVHPILIYYYEEGRKQPMTSTLLRLCRGLKVSIAAFNNCELFEPKEKKPKQKSKPGPNQVTNTTPNNWKTK